MMSLYDDFDVVKQKSDGWSSGMKLFQSQMQLKKAAQTQVCALFILNITQELLCSIALKCWYRKRI